MKKMPTINSHLLCRETMNDLCPTSFLDLTLRDPLRGMGMGVYRDARVIREGPTTADVYIDTSPFYGMAPATVSGYRFGGRRYA